MTTVLDTSVPALLAIAGRRLAPLVRAWLRTVRFGSGVASGCSSRSLM